MQKVYHPNAWLSNFRNIKPGLARRTKILYVLEKKFDTAKHLSENLDTHYSTILYHLHLLEGRNIIERTGSKPPYFWKLNPVGQQRLNNY